MLVVLPFLGMAGPAQGAGSGIGLAGQAAFDAVTQNATQMIDAEEHYHGASVALAADTVWDLAGTITARGFGVNQTAFMTGTLTLHPDRTYEISIVGEPVMETGVWFESRKGILLFQQNILAQLVALEADIASDVGEPVVISITRTRGRVTFSKKTNGLSLGAVTSFDAFFPLSNVSFPLSTAVKLEGTLAP